MTRNRDIATILGRTENNNAQNNSILFNGTDVGLDSNQVTIIATDAGIAVYNRLDSLPTSNLTLGDRAFIESDARYYISNGSGWYNVSLVNISPTFDSDINSSFTILDSATPLVISNPASDSDNGILTYGGSFSDSGQYMVILSRDSSVWTFTPLSADSVYNNVTLGNIPDSNGGSFTYTFTASDGINQASKTITITYEDLKTVINGLSDFDPDWGSGASIPAYDTVDNRVMESDGSTTQFGNDFSMSRDGNYIGSGTRSPSAKGNSQEVIAKWNGSSWVASEQFVSTANTAENDRTALANTDNAYGGGNRHFDDQGNYYIVPYGSANVGALSDVGYLHVHARSGDTWSQQQIINVASPTATRWSALGSSINGDGDYIAYSDWWKANGSNARVGAVEIWNRSGSTWSRQTTITSTNTAQRRFGCSTAFNKDGTYLAITFPFSAYFDGHGGVEIWTRSGSSWSRQATLTPSDVDDRWEPGRTVDISDDGDVVMIGSSIYDTHGAAFVWTRSGSTWTQRQKFTIADAGASASSDRFGSAVSMSGDGKTIVISAIFADSPSSNDGGVYVYQSTDLQTWTYQRNLVNNTAMAQGGAYRVPITQNGGKIAFMSFNTNSGADFAGTIYLADLTK